MKRTNDMYTLEVLVDKEWRVVSAQEAIIGGYAWKRCKHCNGQVRMHQKHTAKSPREHAEHILRSDSENCRAGFHFQGNHQMSANPIT